jgi:hypothetical protein
MKETRAFTARSGSDHEATHTFTGHGSNAGLGPRSRTQAPDYHVGYEDCDEDSEKGLLWQRAMAQRLLHENKLHMYVVVA